MYADVVVLTYQPPNINYYTYEVPKNLESQIKIGQLVSVPFGKRTPLGIVLHLRQAAHPRGGVKATSGLHPGGESIQIKPISSIVFADPLLLPYQIQLLKWLSFYYHAPMVNCLKAILPAEALNAKRLTTNAPSRQTIHPRAQTLVLVPNVNRLPEILASYPQAKNYAVYHGELKMSEKITTWIKILSGHTDYIFGSRSSVFVPCPNLTKITIYDEHDQAYKDERSPYYDTLTVAEKICDLTNAKLEIIDSVPKITTYFAHKTEVRTAHPRGVLQATPRPHLKIISMLDEKRAGNKSPISDLLTDYLRYAQKNHKGVLLFLNKKSQSGSLYCRACRRHEFAAKQPQLCPNCQSPDLWFNSLNVTSLANLVKQIVPPASIHLIAEGLTQFTVHIATAAVFYLLARHQYDLVAGIATDSLLSIPDFTSAERLYQQITELKKLARGMLVLQTYQPDHPVMRAATTANWQQFFNQELHERQTLKYPPFALLVKLTLRDKNEKRLESKAKTLFDELNLLIVNCQLSTVLLGPYRSILGKTPRYNIILKVPIADYSLATREKAVQSLEPLLSNVPREWQITVEPGSLNS